MWDRYPEQVRTTPARTVDDQAMIITPATSQLHTLNATGTFIWEKADGSRTLAAICALLREEFAGDDDEDLDEDVLRQDAEAFVTMAEQQGLLRVHDAPVAS